MDNYAWYNIAPFDLGVSDVVVDEFVDFKGRTSNYFTIVSLVQGVSKRHIAILNTIWRRPRRRSLESRVILDQRIDLLQSALHETLKGA
jgi:hypothetical protein